MRVADPFEDDGEEAQHLAQNLPLKHPHLDCRRWGAGDKDTGLWVWVRLYMNQPFAGCSSFQDGFVLKKHVVFCYLMTVPLQMPCDW